MFWRRHSLGLFVTELCLPFKRESFQTQTIHIFSVLSRMKNRGRGRGCGRGFGRWSEGAGERIEPVTPETHQPMSLKRPNQDGDPLGALASNDPGQQDHSSNSISTVLMND